MPQIMLVGSEIFEIPDSSAKSLAKSFAALALAENNPNETFTNCLNLLTETIESATTLFFFTSKNDNSRTGFLRMIAGKGIKIFVFYAGNAESIPDGWKRINF